MAPKTNIVMVIEDEEEARSSLIQILEFEGIPTTGFANGAEALAYLQKSELPRLIVLDLRTPVMDGPQFRAAQQRDPRIAHIPVVVVTAMDPSAAAGLSALRVFRKPVDLNALIALVKQNCC
jgi:CheY-like chemotaxis protein